ncbi:MAG TPA: DinB family protein [Nocardioidaceae bacterium]|nr:DinB family protein [Nocardioidaceae bacterium]
MTWTAPPPVLPDGPVVGDDRAILEGYLAWQRATLLNICAGLTAAQLAERPLPGSNLSLLGLVRHLAKVERIWFGQCVGNRGPLFDPGLGKDHDFEDGRPEQAEAALAVLAGEWRSADSTAAGLSFDDTFDTGRETWSLRMLYVHLIGEYARHNGHADLVRQHLDGVTAR